MSRLFVKIAPEAPSSNPVTLKTVVSLAPPSYTGEDMRGLTGAEEAMIPHGYAESIMIPVARNLATRSHFFLQKDMAKKIEEEARSAMLAIGYASPDNGSGSEIAKALEKLGK